MAGLKHAAIILLGMGETCAAEILKSMNHKEVDAIIDAMHNLGDISEQEVIQSLHEFFRETKNTTGINLSSSKYFRNTLLSAVGLDKAESILDETMLAEEYKGIDLLRWQPLYAILDALEEEHPQVIIVALMSLDSELAAQVLNCFPSDIKKSIIKKMTSLSPVSNYAMRTLSDYLQEKFTNSEKYKLITADGLDRAANIIRCMGDASEREIMSYMVKENKDLSDKLQDRLFPFERLALLDKRTLQALLGEVKHEDLVLSIKGADEAMRKALLENLSSKTAELIQDDVDSLGAVKEQSIIDAQKRMVEAAKKLLEEQSA
jgi:flagellar motor switch protein FliG